ncbi:hypothetical protein PR048_027071 [Dryococelus australis]|uniref:Uncharacterized protein n=1 Tax=Dryococelus australis TaxID=614101 RepID=A0ABQ9GEE5_9NEOP|nr:hypothetical protein PR048_027071 [Dryococelus australis]
MQVGHASEEESYEGSEEAMAEAVEASSKDKVVGSVCLQFLKLGSGWCGVVILASTFLLLQAAFSACDYWVAYCIVLVAVCFLLSHANPSRFIVNIKLNKWMVLLFVLCYFLLLSLVLCYFLLLSLVMCYFQLPSHTFH